MVVTRRTLARVLACAALAACAHAAPRAAPATAPSPSPAPPEDTWYARAVADAREPREYEISRELHPIHASSPGLSWEGAPGASRVRVATWTSWDGFDARVGQPFDLRETWVTPAPDLQDACRATGLTGDALARRLEQLLGLPANNGKTRVVELFVAPEDMFRACIDAEIDDDACDVVAPPDVSEAHRAWIEALRARSYPADGAGYPWSQLGYTYDWGRWESVASHFGLSEYVVRAGAHAHVVSVSPTDAYCAR
jgi:hypothetical protein